MALLYAPACGNTPNLQFGLFASVLLDRSSIPVERALADATSDSVVQLALVGVGRDGGVNFQILSIGQFCGHPLRQKQKKSSRKGAFFFVSS
jgi:hypothetical protein